MENTQKEDKTPKQDNKNASKVNKKFLFPLLLAVAIAGAIGWYFFSNNKTGSSVSTNLNETVAVVNGENITRANLEAVQQQILGPQANDQSLESDTSDRESQTQALDSLIAQTLLKQEIEKANISIPEEDVNEQIADIKSQFESQEAFEEALSLQGLSEDILREQLESQMKAQAYLDQAIDTDSLTASEAEIQEFYEQSVAQSENAPSLEETQEQIEQLIVQQKQQEKINKLIETLRSEANIEILI